MKRISLACAALLLTITFPTAHAAEAMPLRTTDGSTFGFQFFDYLYEEEVGGAFFMSTEGDKFGVTAGLTRFIEEDRHFLGEFRYATGDVLYTGSGTGDGVPDKFWELRTLVGTDMESRASVFMPFFGLGYRTLFNDLRVLGAGGYRRKSEYFYLPIGVTHRTRAGEGARLSTTLEYDFLLRGKQTSYLSDIPGYSDLVNAQTKGRGLRFSVDYETAGWSVGLFFNHWDIDDSEIDIIYFGGAPFSYGYEPKNITNETGVQVRLRF